MAAPLDTLEPLSTLERGRQIVLKHLMTPNVSYAEGRQLAEADVARVCAETPSLDISESDLRAWLSRFQDETDSERPPVPWYAGAIAASMLVRSVPVDLMCNLLRTANYFGDYKLVHILAARLEPLNDRVCFDVLKQSGKGHKNNGDFELARECYRRALNLAYVAQRHDYVAYFLLLYAKLCDRYQQRSAWYQAFHQIAHNRLKALHQAGWDNPRLDRWLQISEDALAKLLYPRANHQVEGETLFERALSRTRPDGDACIRVLWHRFEARTAQSLSVQAKPNMVEISSNMAELLRLVHLAKQRGNDRAWIVRRLQYLQLARKIIQQCGDARLGFLGPFFEGEGIEEARRIERASRKLNDHRTTAMASFERAKWRQLAPSFGAQPDPAAVIEDMEVARGILMASQDWMFDLYYDVVMDLGDAYEQSEEWSSAIRLYERAYDYCKDLQNGIEIDEERIDPAQRGSFDTAPIEIRLLGSSERQTLCENLRHDYRVLLQRTLKLGERIQTAQNGRRVQSAKRRFGLGPVRYHDIARKLTEELPDQGVKVAKVMGQISKLLVDWRMADHDRDLRRIDLPQEIVRLVKRHTWKGTIDTGDLVDRHLVVNSDEELIEFLLYNLLQNAEDAAERARRTEYNVKINLNVVGGIVYLGVEDNVGDAEVLSEVVERVNKRERPHSRRSTSGGAALFCLHEYLVDALMLEQRWTVRILDSDKKELILPIGRRISEGVRNG